MINRRLETLNTFNISLVAPYEVISGHPDDRVTVGLAKGFFLC